VQVRSAKLLQNAAVRDATANYLVDQLYANVDVAGELKSRLPAQLQPLAGPISGALRNGASTAAQKALASPRVQDIWKQANKAADQTLVNVVNGGNGAVQVNGGEVSSASRRLRARQGRPVIASGNGGGVIAYVQGLPDARTAAGY
jgi:hypothetical protein